MTPWRARIEPFVRPVFFVWARMTRGMTLGVRGVAIDAEGRVLLVRHTYVHGWWLPGGGVERGQTAEQAMIRELREEAGLIVEGSPTLVSIHSAERHFRGDHVLLFRVDRFTLVDRPPDGEIAEIGWFAPDALPDDAHRATRARLAEIFDGAACDASW